MRFNPKTEKELQDERNAFLLPKGDYDFQVMEALDTTSKSGNDMIKLTLHVFDALGVEHTVFDYLLEAMSFKFKHFCDAVGLSSQYEAGVVGASDCIGKSGTVEIIVQEDKNGQYAPRNSVKDYIVSLSKDAVKGDPNFKDSELPF